MSSVVSDRDRDASMIGEKRQTRWVAGIEAETQW
jgi:hypothetical protein